MSFVGYLVILETKSGVESALLTILLMTLSSCYNLYKKRRITVNEAFLASFYRL